MHPLRHTATGSWTSTVALLLGLSGAVAPSLSLAEDQPAEDQPAEDQPAEDQPAEDAPQETPETPETPAEDPPAPELPEGDWIDLEQNPDFGSAVDTSFETDAEEGDLTDGLHALFGEERPAVSKRPTTRWGVRPLLGLQGALPIEEAQAVGGSAGLRIAHQWWSPTTDSIRPAGETRLQASGLFGGVSGFDATLDAVGGSWFGPIGVFGGGMARADRRSWTPEVSMRPAVGVGPSAQVAFKLGKLTPWAGVSPSWLVAGDRQGLQTAPWDELTVRGGVTAQRQVMQLRLSGGYRQVVDAALWDLCVGLHLGVSASKSQRPASKS